MPQQEQVFMDEGEILVTNARIRLQGGKTFATANVTSVATKVRQLEAPPAPSKQGPGCLIAFGVMWALIGLGNLSSVTGFVVLAISAALIYGGWQWMSSLKAPARPNPEYVLMIGSASGESEGMVSMDEALVARISDAINDALISRG